MILQKLPTIGGVLLAKGATLCSEKLPDIYQFLQNTLGEPDFGSFCRKFSLKAISLLPKIFNKFAQNQGRHILLGVSGRTLES